MGSWESTIYKANKYISLRNDHNDCQLKTILSVFGKICFDQFKLKIVSFLTIKKLHNSYLPKAKKKKCVYFKRY